MSPLEWIWTISGVLTIVMFLVGLVDLLIVWLTGSRHGIRIHLERARGDDA